MDTTDGKDYYFLTTFEEIGMHTFRFRASYGDNKTASNQINGPWVNLTLQNAQVRPDRGNITDVYNFTVTYGDYNNNMDPEIELQINQKTFDFLAMVPASLPILDKLKTLPSGCIVRSFSCSVTHWPQALILASASFQAPVMRGISGICHNNQ